MKFEFLKHPIFAYYFFLSIFYQITNAILVNVGEVTCEEAYYGNIAFYLILIMLSAISIMAGRKPKEAIK